MGLPAPALRWTFGAPPHTPISTTESTKGLLLDVSLGPGEMCEATPHKSTSYPAHLRLALKNLLHVTGQAEAIFSQPLKGKNMTYS